ncbi:MAG: YqaJ viral recombinase family protein [Spirochaetes bacterium]|nr:YqaJ viral recombinase family protein [Spirochaetota bacterium]
MQLLTMPQGSIEWLAIRSKYPTASEFDQLVSPVKLKVREGKSIASYVATKLAEKWMGAPLEGFTPTANMDQGTIRETEAWPWYALEYDRELTRPGFIVADDGRCGCSPDGIVEADRFGLEIKCPDADTHVGYLLAGELPNDYLMQVQGSMLVTGFDSWTFLSYHPRFPQLVIDVPRDSEVIASIREGLDAYWRMFETGWKRLIAANGGVEPEHGATP